MRTVYQVTYTDDFNSTHLIFLTDMRDILFLMNRYGKEVVSFEKTESFTRGDN